MLCTAQYLNFDSVLATTKSKSKQNPYLVTIEHNCKITSMGNELMLMHVNIILLLYRHVCIINCDV